MVHLLQVYSNPAPGVITPQELLFRSSPRNQENSTTGTRRRARQLRADEAEAVATRYLAVRNVRTVAAEFGLSRTTVARILSDRGIDASRMMTEGQIAIAVELYESGQSSAVIGKQLGFDNHTILKGLRSRGVRIRLAAAQRREGDSGSVS